MMLNHATTKRFSRTTSVAMRNSLHPRHKNLSRYGWEFFFFATSGWMIVPLFLVRDNVIIFVVILVVWSYTECDWSHAINWKNRHKADSNYNPKEKNWQQIFIICTCLYSSVYDHVEIYIYICIEYANG